MLLNRQREITTKARNDRATSLRLERTVRERTKELTKINIMLASEVEERKQAELQLRQAQNELIQTGKLAALGQMSASLSHEYNQPLSATKAYADNAIKYLELGRTTEVKNSISHISKLADRMGEISKHLRNFARKPNISFGAISINNVINDALEVMSGRIKSENALVEIDIGEEDIFVLAGNIRLQQVIVNIISNALDSMSDLSKPRINISISKAKGKISLHIRDYGRAIAKENPNLIFDPFFTTKEVGKGLGLGLSISYNIIKDFGGRLYARNYEHGGDVGDGSMAGVLGTGAKRPTAARKNETNGDKNKEDGGAPPTPRLRRTGGETSLRGVSAKKSAANNSQNGKRINGGGVGDGSKATNGDKHKRAGAIFTIELNHSKNNKKG